MEEIYIDGVTGFVKGSLIWERIAECGYVDCCVDV